MRLFWHKPMTRYTLKPSKHDPRNYTHKDQKKRLGVSYVPLSGKVSHRDQSKWIYQQGARGTCQVNMGCEMMEQRRIANNYTSYQLSRMFLSASLRYMLAGESFTSPIYKQDDGASILDTFKAMVKYGTIPEEMYPYNDSLAYFQQIPYTQQCRLDGLPDATCFTNVMLINTEQSKASGYVFAQDINDIKEMLELGFNVGIGIDVYPNFEVYRNGVYNGKIKNEQILGGHAIEIIGYDDLNGCFECQNSWGNDWGYQGFFYMGYGFATDMLNKYDAGRISMTFENSMQPTEAKKKAKKVIKYGNRRHHRKTRN